MSDRIDTPARRLPPSAAFRPLSSVLCLLSSVLCLLFAVRPAEAQMLRFSNHRENEIPEYATIRLGPFYSNIEFSQTAGYRYVATSGAGVDFIFSNDRGEIKDDGSDIPLISTLTFQNYLMLNRYTDVEFSFTASYYYYPFGTQDNEFELDFVEEGIGGTLSFEFRPTDTLRIGVSDDILYKTDFVDTRGIEDSYGGSEYTYLENTLSADIDWMVGKDQNVPITLSRIDNIPMDDGFDDQEVTTYEEAIGFEQMFGPFVMAGIKADFSQNDYKLEDRSDSSQQDYSLYSRVTLTRRSELYGSLGYSIGKVDNPDPDAEAEPGSMIGSIGLKTDLSKEWSHTLGWIRSQDAGFASDFEITDTYSYLLNWRGDLVTSAFHATYETVDPNQMSVSGYSDLDTGITITYPLTSSVDLDLSTTYELRTNDVTPETDPAEIEWANDYSTWTTHVGTTIALMEDLDFEIYYEHVVRDGDTDELTYTQDLVEALLTYRYQF